MQEQERQPSLAEVLASLSARPQQGGQAYDMNPPPPIGPQYQMPAVTVDRLGGRSGFAPHFSGAYTTPAAGGEVSLQGQYQPNTERPEWGASLGYKRRF
jgi:hypothetical protein